MVDGEAGSAVDEEASVADDAASPKSGIMAIVVHKRRGDTAARRRPRPMRSRDRSSRHGYALAETPRHPPPPTDRTRGGSGTCFLGASGDPSPSIP
jgi:hypothetical protein